MKTNTPIEPKPPETATATASRELSFGARVGRLITKLNDIDADEQSELAQSPATIRAKYQAKRDAALKDQDPKVVAAAKAATQADPASPTSAVALSD